MKRLSVIIIFICLAFAAKAQNAIIDSLNNELAKAGTEEAQLTIKYQLINYISKINLDSAIALGNEVILDAQKINFKWGEANALNNTGNALLMKGNFPAAKQKLVQAEVLFLEARDTLTIGFVYSSFGQMYGMQSKYDSANYYFFKAIEISERRGDVESLGTNYGNVAIGFMMQSQYKQALEYQQKALDLAKAANKKSTQAYILLNMGINYQRMEDYPRSEKTLLDAISIAKAIGLKNVEAYCYSNLASLYRNLNNWNESYNYAMKGVEIAKTTGDIGIEAASYAKAAVALANLERYEEAKELIFNGMKDVEASGQPLIIGQLHEAMGQTLLLQKEYKDAIPYFEKALAVIAETDEYDASISMMYFDLALCYEKTELYKDALFNFKKYAAINDSIRAKENVQKGTEQLMTYEFEKKEEAQRLEQKNKDEKAQTRQRILTIGLLFMVLLALVVSLAFRSKKKSNEKLRAQKEEIQRTLTKLTQTQTQLIQAEKMASLGELTAGIAHEIQNPLNFVNNFSDVSSEMLSEMKEELASGNLESAKELSTELIENMNQILKHGKRADGIVKGMLQHSRTNNELKEPTNINTLADEYLRLAYHGLRAKDKSFNATLNTDFDSRIGKIELVRNDIGRVVLNLITNAFYAVDAKRKEEVLDYKPTVTITTETFGNKVAISIKDNGDGIPAAVIDKIFQPFFTTKPAGQGTGLGLSLSYDIINRHGGELKVETEIGEGTVFTIELPFVSKG